jgi:hypothetical protein
MGAAVFFRVALDAQIPAAISTIAMSLDGYGQGVPDLNREANYAVVSDVLQ